MAASDVPTGKQNIREYLLARGVQAPGSSHGPMAHNEGAMGLGVVMAASQAVHTLPSP